MRNKLCSHSTLLLRIISTGIGNGNCPLPRRYEFCKKHAFRLTFDEKPHFNVSKYQQAVHKYPNLLNRCFDQTKPNQFWVTDITYIPIPGSMLYMCAVLDLCGKVVLAWKIGSDMSSSLVTDTIREALKHEKVTGGLALHSDQGSQYTSKAYFDLTQEYHVSPSMSSPGCPYDNAAMENFFGTLKTECLYRARFSSRTEVEQLVSEYVYFYNFERISLKNGLTPVEFRGKAA